MEKSVGSRAAFLAKQEQTHAAEWAASARGFLASANASQSEFRKDQFLRKARRAQRKSKSYARCALGLTLAAINAI